MDVFEDNCRATRATESYSLMPIKEVPQIYGSDIDNSHYIEYDQMNIDINLQTNIVDDFASECSLSKRKSVKSTLRSVYSSSQRRSAMRSSSDGGTCRNVNVVDDFSSFCQSQEGDSDRAV